MFQKNYSLQQLTTFGTEAYASYFIELQSEKEIQKAVKNRDTSLSVFVMGGGSNILFTEDYNGYIFKNSIQGIEIIEENETTAYVCSGGGVVWDNLVAYCVEHQLGGIENLSLIPGSVGASPIQNIGAYGVEVKDVFHSLTAVSMNTGEVHTFSVEECQFGYRDSIFKRELKGKYCVSNVTFKLTKASSHKLSLNYGAINDTLSKEGVFSPTIKDVRKAVCSIRSSKLPDPTVLGNAGSFFKNPELPIEVFQKIEINFPDIPRYII
ncbi:MAG: UDP-N-acetylmuramate dehydrogenase [Cyclobacteriaceae bacterium]